MLKYYKTKAIYPTPLPLYLRLYLLLPHNLASLASVIVSNRESANGKERRVVVWIGGRVLEAVPAIGRRRIRCVEISAGASRGSENPNSSSDLPLGPPEAFPYQGGLRSMLPDLPFSD